MAPTGINRPGTSSPAFRGYSKPSNRPTSPGSGYTPGGDSFKNYSQKDQAMMFNQAGGKDKFIEQAIATQAKYPRSLDYQKYLDRAKQYQAAQVLGAKEFINPAGIQSLNLIGTGMKDPTGATILSMQAPTLTAQAPTFRQFMGDVGRGVSSMLGGITQLPGQLYQAYQKFSPMQNIISRAMDYGSKIFNPNDLAARLQAAGPEAQRMYAMYMQQQMPYQQAFELATGQKFAMGGIASLN